MHHLYVVARKVFRRRERRLSKAAKETEAGGKDLKLVEHWTSVLAWKGIFLRRYDRFDPESRFTTY
jgi:cob(I)alamin adenosyltransferase